MGHGHSHGGKKCQGHGHAHGQQQQQQQQPTMTYEQAMRDPVMRGKIIAKKKRAKYIRLGSQILFFLVCFSLFWFYGRSVDEYLDPPKDRPDAVKARLRAAHGGATTFQEAKQKLAKTKTQPATWLHSNAAGQTYLQNNARKEGVISLPSGVQYKVLIKGSGTYHPTVDSPCSTHYEGKLINGKVFDSSYARGSPTTFAPNQVIKGWTEIMQLMVEGDQWEVTIPSDLAYGKRGSGADIKGGATLIFKMEIIKIQGKKVAV
jgi:FKBP-type peptidyl-prolyl cis-trans isomerase FklB